MADFLMGWGTSAWARAREHSADIGWCWRAHDPDAGALILAFREGAVPFDGGWFADDELVLAWVGDWRNATDYPRARIGARRQGGGNARLAARLAALWCERGEAMLDALHGVLACVVWERRAQRLWLVRDKLGLVPLVFSPAGYGSNHERGLLVSSDADWLAGVSGQPPRPNLSRLQRFMLGTPDTSSDDFVEGHYRVRPRERVMFPAPDRPEHSTYWRPDTTYRHDTHSFDRALRDMLEEVLLSVARGPNGMTPSSRLAGEGARLGVEMSGGVDSTAIAALLTELARRTPTGARDAKVSEPVAFSMVAPGLPRSDESREIAEVVEHLRIQAYAFSIADHWPLRAVEVFRTRPMLGPHLHAEEHYIEQFHRFAQSTAPFARLVNGVGADQLLNCAPFWYGRRLWETGAIAELLAMWMSRDVRWFDTRFVVSCLFDALGLKPRVRRLAAAAQRRSLGALEWYDPRNWMHNADWPSSEAWGRPPAKTWNQRQLAALDEWAWELDRRTLYREAARVQLELVSPMFDDRLWELCLRMPAEYVQARGVEKAPLRRVVRGLLPTATVERRKFASFAQVTQRGFIREAHRVHAWFADSRLEQLGLISVDAYRRAFDHFCAGTQDERTYVGLYPLWTTLSAEIWLNLFSDRGCVNPRRSMTQDAERA